MPASIRDSRTHLRLARPRASQPGFRRAMSGSETDVRVLGMEALTHSLTHADALYAFAWRLARDRAVAEDLGQETFARGVAGGRSFAPGSNLKAWLFRILRNAFLDLRRREGKSPLRPALDFEPAAESSIDPDQLRNLHAQELDAALADLTDEQRSVVLLDAEGFSEQEIANVTGLNVPMEELDKAAPIVVFTHRPLWDLKPDWDWTTADGQKAIDMLMPYSNVTVFFGHIHQTLHQNTGHIQHHAARSLMFAFPPPETPGDRNPIPWDPDHPEQGLGYRQVEVGTKSDDYTLSELAIDGSAS
jgi:RNA polymerase sigma factor (sigma-70 family)